MSAKKSPTDHGAVAAQFDDLTMKRKVRRRKDGDGLGPDVGIGLVGSRLEKILDKLPKETKARMLEHIRLHVDEAMKPILRAIERTGDDYELEFIRGVGPNMLRTFIEYLEDKTKD
jgi:hypothetical protein